MATTAKPINFIWRLWGSGFGMEARSPGSYPHNRYSSILLCWPKLVDYNLPHCFTKILCVE